MSPGLERRALEDVLRVELGDVERGHLASRGYHRARLRLSVATAVGSFSTAIDDRVPGALDAEVEAAGAGEEADGALRPVPCSAIRAALRMGRKIARTCAICHVEPSPMNAPRAAAPGP